MSNSGLLPEHGTKANFRSQLVAVVIDSEVDLKSVLVTMPGYSAERATEADRLLFALFIIIRSKFINYSIVLVRISVRLFVSCSSFLSNY